MYNPYYEDDYDINISENGMYFRIGSRIIRDGYETPTFKAIIEGNDGLVVINTNNKKTLVHKSNPLYNDIYLKKQDLRYIRK